MKKNLFFVLAIVVMALTFFSFKSEDVPPSVKKTSLDIGCREFLSPTNPYFGREDEMLRSGFLETGIYFSYGYVSECLYGPYLYRVYRTRGKIDPLNLSDPKYLAFVDSLKNNVVADSSFENLSKAPVAPVEESSFTITKSDFVIASGFFFFGFIVSAMIIIVVGEKRLKEEQKKIDKEENKW